MHRKRAQKILGEIPNGKGRPSELAETRRICALRASHEIGGRWKSHRRKIVHLSSFCRKTFKLKGNKKFRTWTKKSWVFFVFRDSYDLCIYIMNIICMFHVSVSGYGTGIVIKVLIQGHQYLEIRGHAEIIQTTVLLRSARIVRGPGNIMRLSITQTPEENHQQTLMEKNLKWVK